MKNNEARKIVNRLAREARARDSDRLISEALRDTLRTSSTTDRYYDCPTTEIVPERGKGVRSDCRDDGHGLEGEKRADGLVEAQDDALSSGQDGPSSRPAPQFGSARGLVLIADDAFAESVCSEIDSVLADPRLDLQDKVLEAERLHKLRCAYCDGLGYFTHHGRFVCEACNGSGLQAESLEQVEARIQARYDEGDAEQLQPSPLLCAHANEVPGRCPCGSECYCKSHTCRLGNAAERRAWSDRYPESRAVVEERLPLDAEPNRGADRYSEASEAKGVTHHQFQSQGFFPRCKACNGTQDSPYHYNTGGSNAPNDTNTTLNLLRDLEQRVQAVHRCDDRQQQRLLLIVLKGILNAAIAEREEKV